MLAWLINFALKVMTMKTYRCSELGRKSKNKDFFTPTPNSINSTCAFRGCRTGAPLPFLSFFKAVKKE